MYDLSSEFGDVLESCYDEDSVLYSVEDNVRRVEEQEALEHDIFVVEPESPVGANGSVFGGYLVERQNRMEGCLDLGGGVGGDDDHAGDGNWDWKKHENENELGCEHARRDGRWVGLDKQNVE